MTPTGADPGRSVDDEDLVYDDHGDADGRDDEHGDHPDLVLGGEAPSLLLLHQTLLLVQSGGNKYQDLDVIINVDISRRVRIELDIVSS